MCCARRWRKGGSMVIVGLPVMLEDDANADAHAKNKIFRRPRRQVGSPTRRPTCSPGPRGAAPDVYKPFLPNAKNNMVLVRASDGIHFTTVGYDMVMESIYPAILASLKARGRDLATRMPAASRREVTDCGREPRNRRWTLIVAIGGGGVGCGVDARNPAVAVRRRRRRVAIPIAERLVDGARIGHTSLGAVNAAALAAARQTDLARSRRSPLRRDRPTMCAAELPSTKFLTVAVDLGARRRGASLLRAAMERRAARPLAARRRRARRARGGRAVGAHDLRRESPPMANWRPTCSPTHRLTILQLGDSHTAADFFTGRVRERLQQAFGDGRRRLLVPGKPHVGVRSALFASDAVGRLELRGAAEAPTTASALLSLRLQRGRASRRRDADLAVRATAAPMTTSSRVPASSPAAARRRCCSTATPPARSISTAAADRARDVRARGRRTAQGFREIEVRTLDDAPVAVTGVEVGREGDGVSYLSLGYPGATVQLLQRLDGGNFADDIRRLAPDIVVLAFGTNEGFNDNLDVSAYIAQYEQIVRRLQALRPGVQGRDGRPAPTRRGRSGQCHADGVGQNCTSAPASRRPPRGPAAAIAGCRCRRSSTRCARRSASSRQRLGAAFWDWSSDAGRGPCGAQVWAAANPPLMAHDYVHMTLEGYKQSADRFADFLIPLIEGRPAADACCFQQLNLVFSSLSRLPSSGASIPKTS